jgi:serine O-acetyltransferase
MPRSRTFSAPWLGARESLRRRTPSPVIRPKPVAYDEELPSLIRLLREDARTNGQITKPGFHALAVHRFGVWRIHLRGVSRVVADLLYRAGYVFVRNVYGIELFYTTQVGRRFEIGHQGGIVIHPRSIIGDDCSIHQNVTLGAASDKDWERQAPVLGNGVALGAGVVVLGSVTIGDGARVGPNCVVLTDVPPGAVVFVAPPRMVLPRSARDSS